MLFVVFCLDKPDAGPRRAAAMEAHKRYIDTKPVKILLSGPLTSDDGQRIVGSFFMVEAADRAAVERFQQNDPLYQAGIWETIEVRAFAKRIDNRD
ncbi:MAG TPA: YciI family protein [Gammaproteobacteria bacterium]